MYQHPGVYIEHVPSGALSIEAASTSVTAFVGNPGRGVPVNTESDPGEPVFISSMSQYAQMFGPAGPSAGGIKDFGQNPDAFCLLYTSPSPRDLSTSRMPSSA